MQLKPAPMPDVLTAVAGTTYIASTLDHAEQLLRIVALVVTIAAAALSIYQRLKKKKDPKAATEESEGGDT